MAITRSIGGIPIAATIVEDGTTYNSALFNTTLFAWVNTNVLNQEYASALNWCRSHCALIRLTGAVNQVICQFKTSTYNKTAPAVNATYNLNVLSVTPTTDPDYQYQIGWDPVADYQIPATNYYANSTTGAGSMFYFCWFEVVDGNGDTIAYQLYSFINTGSAINARPTSEHAGGIGVKYLQNRYNATIGAASTDDDLGPEQDPEGYGQDGTPPAFDHSSDVIGIPDKPSIGVLTAGFYHAYKVTQGQLTNFGAKLFPTLGNMVGSLAQFSTVQEALAYYAALVFQPGLVTGVTIANQSFSVVDMILNGKAIDYVIDCHVIPVAPTVGGNENIKCGARELDISVPTCTSDYIDFDCGAVSIPLQYQNFLDLQGVRCRLYLPFVGFTEIAPEYWNGGTLGVKYRFNIIDGSFMAYVYSTSAFSNLAGTVIGQFGGSACLHIPVTGLNYASMVSGLITGSMSLVGSVAAGNAPGVVGSAVNMINMSPDAAQSNNYNSSTSFLGVRRPYMILEYAIPSMSLSYKHDNGFPLNISATIGDLIGTGYTEIEDIDLSGIGATQAELDELKGILASGVYL